MQQAYNFKPSKRVRFTVLNSCQYDLKNNQVPQNCFSGYQIRGECANTKIGNKEFLKGSASF